MTNIQNKNTLFALSYWLLLCCGSVFLMIIIGAITRLSGSGLSIVEWKPLMGAIPPLNEQEWQRVFELYQTSPEYQKKNFWMEISDFKSIFFWEWFHRLLGRLIGIIYAIPFLFFLIKGWIPKGHKTKLFGLFLLGGAQGFMGWYMVKSGLVDIPAVSHYRLTAHLSLALLIYGLMFWLALTYRKIAKNITPSPDNALYTHSWVTLGFLVLTIFWGAYTAGLDAGLIYNDTFPMMGKTWIPEEVWFHKPLWMNFFENHAGVQFTHRWLAIATALVTLSFATHGLIKKRTEISFPLIGAMVLIQIGLGIATLFSSVHLHTAVTHQAGAVLLLTLLITCMHNVYFKPPAPKH
ncbi:MAG: COX15/CtaA family protein [Alphaproteobacteria bacterium]